MLCDSCRFRYGCRIQNSFYRRYFFTMLTDNPVDCPDWAEARWHGVEGVRP